ncbi:hypothetical protein [Flavobacterium sp. YJ01]|uniref:hypothetical protein n=1 Tax=unclassified Flavobacterium TaxID=196869 RepID=UPI0023E4743B|nr:hypothetical protein [Flavobacterium sp. YJ01]WET04849.1 hypothetical protein P0R33_11020 [Flavobacterium sp. YJ01]
MIQTGITLTDIIKFIQKYLNILIIVPAFIGGLWQLIELSNISISFIRFFSLSQIVSDGLLILIFMLIASFTYMLGWFGDRLFFINKQSADSELLNSDDYEKHRKKELSKWMVIFLMSYSFSLFYFLKFMYKTPNFTDLKSSVSITLIFIITLNRTLNACYNFAQDKHKKIFKLCNFFLLILYVIIAIFLSKRIHSVFINTNNIINIENIKKDVSLKYPNTKQELLYFNDKYLFIKLINIPQKASKDKKKMKKEDKVYIMELNKLFTK